MGQGSSLRTLHFTMAPVQGFVAQARRTRDFWAGSYIISYLTAHAMNAVVSQDEGNRILFPDVSNDGLFRAVAGLELPMDERDPGARVASLPNRFSARCVDPVAAGRAAETAVNEAWTRLALGVWQTDIRPRLLHLSPEIQTLIDMGSDDEMPSLWKIQLENLWEVYWVADAGGPAVDQRKNWRHTQLFSEQGEVCSLCGERVIAFGAGLSRNDVRKAWHGTGDEIGIADVLTRRRRHELDDKDRERLCAVCLVKRIWPLVADEVSGWTVRTRIQSTQDLCPPASTPGGDSPFPYYAVLVMDGDSLGSLLSKYENDPDKQTDISRALADFSQSVPGIVEGPDFRGECVYAGGDDVLALLPARHALECARRIRRRFIEAGREVGVDDPMTISAGIHFVHMKSPMQKAIREAQRLLDDTAKDAMGRDAFAVRVEKRSGTPMWFAKRWDKDSESGADDDWVDHVQRLASSLLGDEPQQSSGFLYRTAATLEPFAETSRTATGPRPDRETLLPMLTAEYLRGPARLMSMSWEAAEAAMSDVLDLCEWQPGPTGRSQARAFQPDALPIIRFLAETEKGALE